MTDFKKEKCIEKEGKAPCDSSVTEKAQTQNSKKDLEAEKCRTIFVGNLPLKVKKRELKEIFSRFGKVMSARLIYDKKKGNTRYGFLVFERSSDVEKALKASNEQLECYGRTIKVEQCTEKKPKTESQEAEVLIIDSIPVAVAVAARTRPKKKARRHANNANCKISTSKLVSNSGHEIENRFSIDQLSDDDMILIFSYLSAIGKIKIERVCRRWQSCALSAAKIQRRLTLIKEFKGFQIFSENIFEEIIKRSSQNLKYLDISRVSTSLGNRSLSIIENYCSNLEELNMSGVKADDEGLEILSHGCQNLQAVNLSNCINIGEKGLCSLFSNCKNLEALQYSGLEIFSIDGTFLKYAEPKMRCIDLAYCKKLTNEGAMNIANRCPNLNVLNLEMCELLSQNTLKAILEAQIQMMELNIGNTVPDTTSLPNPHPLLSLSNHSLLTKLEVHNCGLDDKTLSLVCSICKNLSHLDISCNKLTDVSVSQISDLKYIQNLYACHLQNITDNALIDTVRKGNLRKLRLQSCKNLTDNIMKELATACRDLEEIDVAGVTELTCQTLHFFFRHVANTPGCRILFYSSDNELSTFCSTEADFPIPQGLNYINTYRQMYTAEVVWNCSSQLEALDLQEHNLEIKRHRNIQTDDLDDQFGYYSSDDAEYDDEWLVNDDPLAAEHFDEFLD